MTEEQLLMLNEVSILLGQMRRVSEQSAVIRTKYRYLEKNGQPEKNDPVYEKNQYLLKKILGELDNIQDVNIVSRTRIKNLCKQLEPNVDL